MTKNQISEDTICLILHKHYPDEKIIKIDELKNGMFNASYFIRGNDKLSNGVVLKVGPLPHTRLLTYEKDIIKTEIEVYGLLSDVDIPVPKILISDLSRTIINAEYFIMTYIEGTLWSKSNKHLIKKSRPLLMRSLGSHNAKINNVKGKHFGYIKDDNKFRFDNWYDAFYSMVENILTDGKRDNCKLPYFDIINAVKNNKVYLDEVSEPQLVNFDLHAGNVFLKKSGDKCVISGIIDFERCFYGDPYADFTASLLIYSDIEKELDFQNGYNTTANARININKSEQIRMNLYRLYMATILYVESYRYNPIYRLVIKMYSKNLIKKYLKTLNKA